MSARATLRALAVVSFVAAGCNSDPSEPPLTAFAIAPATQWSGGAITIRSPYFVNRSVAPVIVAGNDTMAYSAVDDSTATAQLPLGPSGPVTLALARGPRRDSLATVQRVGFSRKRTVVPALYGELLATDSAGTPFVLGGSFTGTGDREPIVRLRVVPATSQVLTLRQPSNTQYGMAPSIIPGAFTVRDATDSIRLATLLVDAPAIIDSMHWAGTGFTRQVSLLSPHAWLMTNAHQSLTRWDTTSGSITSVNAESPWAVYMSPVGTRTTLATTVASGSGVPVWDNAAGSVAFTLPVPFTEATAFSTDGNTLYVVGGQQISADTVIAVNASSGALVVRQALPNGLVAMGVAYRSTAGGGQLLVGAATPSSLVLLVYRASTLELLG
ncbi:MAG: hypothetical protein ABR537_03300, partial [Gemmatimonadales bacterium]